MLWHLCGGCQVGSSTDTLPSKLNEHNDMNLWHDIELGEKSPDVFNVMLQLLDDGRLTDAQGRMVNRNGYYARILIRLPSIAWTIPGGTR